MGFHGMTDAELLTMAAEEKDDPLVTDACLYILELRQECGRLDRLLVDAQTSQAPKATPSVPTGA